MGHLGRILFVDGYGALFVGALAAVMFACSPLKESQLTQRRVALGAIDREWLVRGQPECFGWRLEEQLRQRDSVPATVCIARFHDTTDYLCTGPDGRPIVHGRRFKLPEARLGAVGDSIAAALSVRLGRWRECVPGSAGPQGLPLGSPYMERYFQWHDSTLTVQLIALTPVEEQKPRAEVTVELLRGHHPCFVWVGEPRILTNHGVIITENQISTGATFLIAVDPSVCGR